MKPKIAIIGAGVSGCFLSHLLHEKADVTLFEKSRGVGGRCSNRRDDSGDVFHHGAQFFTIRDQDIQNYIQPLVDAGTVKEFSDDLVFYKNRENPPEKAIHSIRYVGCPHMNSFLKFWVRSVSCRLQFEVKELRKDQSTWSIVSDTQEEKGFDLCVVTTPIPQASKLTHDLLVYPNIQAAPCYAVMLTTPSYKTSWVGAFIKNSPLSWVAHHAGQEKDQWILHGSPSWSSEQRDEGQVCKSLTTELSCLLNKKIEVYSQKIHFWRYASIQSGESLKPFLWDASHSLGACGDWYQGGRVEGALQSAYRLEQWLRANEF
ncbi:MAG: NAD(P)/FAD-dependent oxidoreductase [Oligoflexales bacterium]